MNLPSSFCREHGAPTTKTIRTKCERYFASFVPFYKLIWTTIMLRVLRSIKNGLLHTPAIAAWIHSYWYRLFCDASFLNWQSVAWWRYSIVAKAWTVVGWFFLLRVSSLEMWWKRFFSRANRSVVLQEHHCSFWLLWCVKLNVQDHSVPRIQH